MKKEKGRSSKRRKLEDGSSKSKSSKYKSSDAKPKRKSSKHSKDKFNPIRAIQSSRKKKDEPQEEDLTQYMDVDIFAGEGQYEAPKPKKKEPEKPKVPRRPIEDVFGLSSLTGELAEHYTPKKRNMFDDYEKEMTNERWKRKMERKAEREWKQIQKINEQKYGK